MREYFKAVIFLIFLFCVTSASGQIKPLTAKGKDNRLNKEFYQIKGRVRSFTMSVKSCRNEKDTTNWGYAVIEFNKNMEMTRMTNYEDNDDEGIDTIVMRRVFTPMPMILSTARTMTDVDTVIMDRNGYVIKSVTHFDGGARTTICDIDYVKRNKLGRTELSVYIGDEKDVHKIGEYEYTKKGYVYKETYKGKLLNVINYSKNNLIIGKEVYYTCGDKDIFSRVNKNRTVEMEYRADFQSKKIEKNYKRGLIMQELITSFDGDTLEMSSFVYDKRGNMIVYTNISKKQTIITRDKYDKYNNLISSVRTKYKSDGSVNILSDSSLEYIYDKKGNWIMQTDKDVQYKLESVTITERKISYY